MSRRTGRRTDYQWGSMADVETGLDLGNVSGRFATTTLILGLASTLMRIRGVIGATLDSAAVNESVLALFGIGLFNTDQVAAGSAPEINVAGNDEFNWMWTGALYLSSGMEAAIVTDQLSASLDIDTKAMRRGKADDVVALVSHTPASVVVDQTGTWDFTYYLHVLQGS